MSGLTLDAGGLIALDRNDRRVVVLLARLAEIDEPITVPATALTQAVRRLDRQVRIARLIRQPRTVVRPLDRGDALLVGRLLANSNTSDVVDAHVVVCAERAGQPIVTSDPDDLRQLDPAAQLIVV